MKKSIVLLIFFLLFFTSLCPAGPRKSRVPIPKNEYDRYDKAKKAIDNKNYKRAYATLAPFFKGQQHRHEYGFELFGHILMRQRKFSEAIPLLKRGIEIYPDNIALIQNLAVSYLRANRPKDAGHEFWRAYLKGERKKPGLGFSGAVSFSRAKAPKKAEKLCRELLKYHPPKKPYILLLGKTLISQNRFKEASKDLEKGTELFPESARLWRLLAMTYYKQDKLHETAAAYKIAHRLSPPSPKESQMLARLLLHIGAPELGENELSDKTFEDKNENAEFLDSMAYMLARSGCLEKALINAEKAESIEPTPERCFRTGQILYRMKEFKKAEKKLASKILEKGEFRDKALRLRSMIAWHQGDWKKTKELLKNSKSLEKKSRNLIQVLDSIVEE